MTPYEQVLWQKQEGKPPSQQEETFGRPRFRKGDWTKTHRGEDRLITTNE